jgi:hypothetical protein
MTVSYAILGGGTPSPPAFNYVQGGVSKSLTLTTTPVRVPGDIGSSWSVPKYVSEVVCTSPPVPFCYTVSGEIWVTTQATSGKFTGGGTIVFKYQNQYYLTMLSNSSGGSVTPSSEWLNAGASVTIKATPSTGYVFTGWAGVGSGEYSGSKNPATLKMNGPITETGQFAFPVLAVSLVSPSNKTTVPASGSSVALKVQVKASGKPVSGATVTIFVNGTQVGTPGTTDSQGYFTYSYTPTIQGDTYVWYATATKTSYQTGTSTTWTFKYK